ncbi:gliding motility-associated ABC transporter substrate-binding protein GldG [Jejuia pallidilutea]|uniref:Gliding motility protein GldF n=1 Tax=Jejuia pallidilutea TaxID=504487 RepID=A0A098LTC4_9FLAO|nr:gliding motility-associated ABC transporter substrate-binding protein GldG [Jejuia pallidilutea]GAL89642.1 gliding motility protein GldF [Jejuia pallidilutea]
MLALLKKEINTFFASPIGYLVIAIFLVLNGLFLWVFKGEFNILDYGFADLSAFFLLAPWILLFLIPAVTMRSFSDEKKQGTLELLLTKPIPHLNIILGKYFGAFVLIAIALLPTLLYVYTVYQLGNPIGNIDFGSTFGSYFGLIFLAGAYTAIGIFCSTLSNNQIVSFIISVFICFMFYIGFEGITAFTSSTIVEQFGMNYHYKSLSRGVIDTRDIIYFLSVIVFFILLTKLGVKTGKANLKDIIKIAIVFSVILVLNTISNYAYKRFDVTKDQRYTLSNSAKEIATKANSPLIVDVFLKGEDFPSEFRRLQTETRQLLEEFSNVNHNIVFQFINPLENEANRQQTIQVLTQRGLTPMQLEVRENGKASQEVIFPWALASYNEQTVIIPLVKTKIGASQQELVSNSVQHLEYAFADGFKKLVTPKSKKIAVLKGNAQLEDKYIADIAKTLGEYYFIAPFTLDSVANNPKKTLQDLLSYHLIISAKPTEAFTENEKFVLDQHTMHGGKSLWLIDAVAMEKDSLYNEAGKNYAVGRDLNVTDLFFNYGFRINPVMIATPYSAPITLAIGDGSKSQFQHLNWPYSPLATATQNHPITNNINLVRFDFANPIDTLKNTVKKTILLETAPISRLEGTPREISLDLVTQPINPKDFKTEKQTLAVLLEGEFKSAFANRIKPFKTNNTKDKSAATKMIVIADGDVVKNDVVRNRPQELGFDRWTGKQYGNKEFLLNAVNYLLDDNGLINIRTKEIDVAFLNQEKIAREKTLWQLLNIGLPIALLAIFGFTFNYLRKKKYAA